MLSKKLNLLTCIASIALCSISHALDIVPLPQQCIEHTDQTGFTLNATTQISYAHSLAKGPAELLASALRPSTGFPLPVIAAKSPQKNSIHFSSSSKIRAKEGYQLNTAEHGAMLEANNLGGFIYASQTLLQLLPAEVHAHTSQNAQWTLPAVSIKDSPTYPWRGMMLDVSRYFLNKDYVKHYIDILAMHKMNVLHWHLIDDCGWRIEIKKYPKLTEIGAWRGTGENRRGGFYTQQDIKEIVAYAAARNVTVIPEIEIPAHTLSALCAYPHLGCTGKQFEMPTRHSISPEIYCVGKESTWDFLEDVLDEVITLFPAKWIHIGGDEARYQRWQNCPDCQACMKKHKLHSPQELQGWTSTRIQKYLKKHDKQIIGWAEILECGVSNKAGIMAWHKPEHIELAAKHGNPVVCSLVRHTYFDTPESTLPGEPSAATWTPHISLEAAYKWDPTPQHLKNTPAAKHILGANGCLWTDQFLHAEDQLADRPGEGTQRSESYVDYLTLPRLAALAEVSWTPFDQRNFPNFKKRMANTYNRYNHAGYHFRMPTPNLAVTRNTQGLQITGGCPIASGSIHYTTDGSTPTLDSPEFTGSLDLPQGSTLTAATFSKDGTQRSLDITLGKELKDYSAIGNLIGTWESGAIGAQKAREVIFDATGKIDSNGDYIITFLYESGDSRLDIDSIQLVRNDTELIAQDHHHGFTGGQSKNNTYALKVQGYQTGASFKIKAKIYGDISDDSNGVVLIRKK